MNRFRWHGLMLLPTVSLACWIGSAPVTAEPASGSLEVETQAPLETKKDTAPEAQLPSVPRVTNPVIEAQTSELRSVPGLKPQRLRGSNSISGPVTGVQFLEHANPSANQKKATKTRGLAQVTSVSQLSDVKVTDWAFQAVQSLVERYGCIEGYPDQTFRGNRVATRYELAAALNACLNQLSAQLGGLTAEDLATIKRLQDEFAAELATLRGRLDSLEARTTELEANQFSTTTKLSGLAWFNVTGATAAGPIQIEAAGALNPPVLRLPGRDPVTNDPIVQTIDEDPNITFSDLVWLTFDTSFTGKDVLTVQLAVGNGDSPANFFTSAGLYNTFGTPFTDQTGGVTVGVNDVIVHDLFYSFPITDTIQAVIGPRINFYRYFDNNAFTYFINGAGSFNSIGSTLVNAIDRGAGAALLFDFGDQFKLNIAYLAENTEFLPNPPYNSASRIDEGLFDATNTLTAELTFSPVDTFNLRLLYTRSNIRAISFFEGAPAIVGGAIGEPLYGFADDGFGGSISNAAADTVNLNFDWLITSRFGVFGRYTFGSTHIDPVDPAIDGGDVNSQAIQAGIAFPDLGREGALAVISYLIPFDVLGGENFLVSGAGNGGTQYEIEASYYFPITDNISLVPAFYAIFNANNFSDNPNIYIGNLRTQFSF